MIIMSNRKSGVFGYRPTRRQRRTLRGQFRDANNLPSVPPIAKRHMVETERDYREKIQMARSILASYQSKFKNADKHLGCSVDIISTKSKQSASIIIEESIRLPNDQVKEILSATMADKGSGLNDRSSRGLGIRDDVDVTISWKQGPQAARIIRNCFTEYEAKGGLLLKNIHCQNSKMWIKGCETEPIPIMNKVFSSYNNPTIMKGCGLQQTNVKKVLGVGPSKTAKSLATACRLEYKSKNRGKKVSRPFGSAIDRHTWKDNTLDKAVKDSPMIQAYLSRVKELYKECLPSYMESHGFCDDTVTDSIDDIVNAIVFTTVLVTDNRPLGIHRDPPTPTPAAVCGPSNYIQEANGHWKRSHLGGNLFLADGMFRLDYGPHDFVIFDGNIAHSVSGLRHLPGSNEDRTTLERFSVVASSRWNKESMKDPGNYTGYCHI